VNTPNILMNSALSLSDLHGVPCSNSPSRNPQSEFQLYLQEEELVEDLAS